MVSPATELMYPLQAAFMLYLLPLLRGERYLVMGGQYVASLKVITFYCRRTFSPFTLKGRRDNQFSSSFMLGWRK